MDERFYPRRGRSAPPVMPPRPYPAEPVVRREFRYRPRGPRRANPRLRAGHAAPPVSARVVRNRIFLVWMLLMLGLTGLVGHLFRLQILDGDRLKSMARGQQVARLTPFVPRRAITDRDNNILAIDRPVYTLYVHPIMFTEAPQAIAQELAPLIDQPVGDLLYKFSQSDSGIKLAERLDQATADQLFALNTNGLDVQQERQRYYPQDDLFSHLVGYVNVDREGQAGVEYVYQDQLERPMESLEVSRTGEGKVLPENIPEELLQQDSLTLKLTVDSQLQRVVRQRLQEQLQRYDTERGAVIVMDVRDGAILSMVSEPSYNPNTYFEAEYEDLRNWPVSDLLEPGSTFKPVNLAIALEERVIQASDTFYDPGSIQVGGWTIKNSDFEQYGGHGTISVTDILKYSSNVGMVQIMQRLEASTYYNWLQRLQIDKTSGIDLPSEASGSLKSRSDFTRALVEPATAAFGQGLSLTPLQLVRLNAAIANGGKLVTPYLVQGLMDESGYLHWQPDRPEPEPVFSPETAQTVLGMMEVVVQDGTGKSAQIPGYRIAGKTGTAQKASQRGGYDASARVTSFISIFPVQAPRYAVLAVIDNPKGGNLFGSTVAAPVVKSVIEFMLISEAIPADEPARLEEANSVSQPPQ